MTQCEAEQPVNGFASIASGYPDAPAGENPKPPLQIFIESERGEQNLEEKQYGAFALNARTLAQHRKMQVRYVPGSFVVEKVIVLSEDGFASLAGDLSAEYVFLEENRDLMSADPGGRFNCVLARTETGKEGILFALQGSELYTAYARDVHAIRVDPATSTEQIPQCSLPRIQTSAVFYHKPRGVEDITGIDYVRNIAERKAAFVIETVVVLSDEKFADFMRSGLLQDELFLFDNLDKMWFDPTEQVWHCLLVKGETSQDGILVEAEGYSYARYAADVRDCARLRLREVPVQYEPQVKPPREKAAERRRRQER